MAVSYDRLFHLMIDKKISNTQLKDMAGVSANIITRLKKNGVCQEFCVNRFNKQHRIAA